jgi:hypothetical protein
MENICAVPVDCKLLAWIVPTRDEFLAAIVGADAASYRAPATQLCSTHAEARQWVEDEAAAIGVPIEWLARTPTD